MAKYYGSIDLMQNELQQARIQNLATAPAAPVDGQLYYNTTAQKLYYWSVDRWVGSEGILYRGAYNDTLNYDLNDVVVYNGNTYISTTETPTAGNLPTDTAYWDMLAQGGVIDYSNAAPMPVAIGGIPAGTTFAQVPLDDVFDMLLYPYQAPGVSSFSMSGQPTTVEVGNTVTGTKTFTWSVSNPSNVQANSVSILDGATPIKTGLGPSGSTTATVVTRQLASPGTYSWALQGTNSKGTQFSSSFTVSWRWRVYSGTSTALTLDEPGIEALATSALASTGTGSTVYSYPAGGYKYLAFPSSMPAATGFTDTSTGFNVVMAESVDDAAYSNTGGGFSFALVNVTNVNGVATQYRVYRTKYVLGGSINIRVV